jgi:hypothetical protein
MKKLSVIYSECVSVALVIQHVKRMLCIKLTSVACLALPYFSTYLINSSLFGGWGGVTERKIIKIEFMKIRCSIRTNRQTERGHDEANSLSSKFGEHKRTCKITSAN